MDGIGDRREPAEEVVVARSATRGEGEVPLTCGLGEQGGTAVEVSSEGKLTVAAQVE
jgi:hypothetical protein